MPLPLSFGNCLSINTHAFQASEIIIWNGAEFQSVGIDPIPSEHTDGAISLVTEDEKCRVLVEGQAPDDLPLVSYVVELVRRPSESTSKVVK